jgi:coatomer subunit beta
VRKNAVLAILFIHKNCEILLPDAPELIRNYISTELDPNAKRNALITLINTNTTLAVEYLSSVWTQIPTFDAPLQLSVLELIRKDCRNPSADKVFTNY